ncbi:sialate O-acetylesterase [Mangrovibacterium sp.]|uniref:sialate O-acetylesterase n=1 Tax=Mangrovibacterium sp. TaxID=1961364 RepID=UPI0035620261
MKLVLIIFAIILFAPPLHAQTRDTLYLWPNEVPGELKVKQAAVVSDNSSGDVIRLAEVTNPCLVVYEPEESNHSGVGIIVCPGGGYNILAIDKGGYEVAEWLNTLGYTAFVLQYRVPKKQEGALQDLQRAIRLVRDKAYDYNLYPESIGLIGFSAGGSLCARASTLFNSEKYAKTDEVDELSCRPNFAMLIYPAYLDQGENRSLTPELTMSDFTPPFFIFGTADDKYGNSSLVMTTALRDQNIPVELHVLAEGGHGYGLRKGNIAAETWPMLAEKWLSRMVANRQFEKHQRIMNFPKLTLYPQDVPTKNDVWVFMMAGQSNMAGRGFVEPQDTIPSERILTINKSNEIIVAKEPLNFYEPGMNGLDCGVSFAKKLLGQVPENVSVLLVPTAVGGSSISQWLGDSIHREVQLLSNFKEKMELAKKHGTIKGILWHQGESDANQHCIPLYEERLTELIGKFRTFAGNNSLPVIVGELGSYSKNKSNWLRLNEQIKKYASKDVHAGIIHTSDLINRGDSLHFDSRSQRTIGERFAIEYLQMAK